MRELYLITLGILSVATISCNRSVSPSPDKNARLSRVVPIKLTDTSFQREVIESEFPVMVDMWSPWCQPCIAMKPTLRQIASELTGKVKVAELNVEENPFIKQKYDVDKYPMLLVFVDGNEVERLIGAKSREELLTVLSDHVAEEKLR